MDQSQYRKIPEFFVAGINYKKSCATIRGQFAIGNAQYGNILQKAGLQGLNELFILSTCNRTEIYGFAESSNDLIELLCSETTGNQETFKASAYIKSGMEAIRHIFHVGAGLDSQILGDYEIVGQLKTAIKFSKERGFIGAFTERLVNCVLQASKSIKNNTTLSSGTVSVSFTAVQYIKKNVSDPTSKKILLIGVGKIGRNTCKNLVDYLGTSNITLINRSAEKAAKLANELGLRSALLEKLEVEVGNADIILVATNSIEHIISRQHLEGYGEKLIIDLSIPYNVESGVEALSNVSLVNVDELSRIKDETLKMRLAEVPKAESIIDKLVNEFTDWYEMRRYAPMLKNLKIKLNQLYPQCAGASTAQIRSIDMYIQKILREAAAMARNQNKYACLYIEELNRFVKQL